MALIVAFPYTGVAFAHTETMKMDELGSGRPPGVCFTLFFYSLPLLVPATSLLFFLFSFIRLLSALSLSGSPHEPAQLPPARSPAAGPAGTPRPHGTHRGSGPIPGAPRQLSLRRTRLCDYLLTVLAVSGAGASAGTDGRQRRAEGSEPDGKGPERGGRAGFALGIDPARRGSGELPGRSTPRQGLPSLGAPLG